MHPALKCGGMAANPMQPSGFTLPEVLTALLITTLAITGMAALQFNALSMTYQASLRTTATLLARDWINRMRANGAAASTDFDPGCWTDRQGCVQPHPECRQATHPAAPCTPAELARDDYTDWGRQLAAQLPGGRGFLCRDDDGIVNAGRCSATAAGNAFILSIAWHERNTQAPCPMINPMDQHSTCLIIDFSHDSRWTRPSWSAQ